MNWRRIVVISIILSTIFAAIAISQSPYPWAPGSLTGYIQFTPPGKKVISSKNDGSSGQTIGFVTDWYNTKTETLTWNGDGSFTFKSPVNLSAIGSTVANCSTISNPVANQTWCFQTSNGNLYVWNGSSWVLIAPTTTGGIIPPSQGGTGLDTSASTGNPTITAGTWSIVAPSSQPYYDAANYANLDAAITAIGSTPATLLIHTTVSVVNSQTVPSTLTLWFLQPGKLSIPTTKTVTIQGQVHADPYPIFSLTGTGAVYFCVAGSPTPCATVDAVYPQWFGAKGDNTTNDSAAFQAAINSVSVGSPQLSGIPVKVPRAIYYIHDTTTITGATQILGSVGQDGARLRTDQAISVFTINMSGNDWTADIGGLTIVGGTNAIEILGTSGSLSHFTKFHDLTLASQTFAGIKIDAGTGMILQSRNNNINCSGDSVNTQYGVYITGSDLAGSSHWDNFRATGTTHAGFQVLNTDVSSWEPNLLFTNPIFEGNNQAGIINSNAQVVLINPHFEQNGKTADVADIYMDGNNTITARVDIHGGVFSGMGAAQAGGSGTRIFFNGQGAWLRIYGTNGSSVKIDGNNKTTNSYVLVYGGIDISAPVNYAGGNYSHYP